MALAPAPDSEATVGQQHWLHQARRNSGWLFFLGIFEIVVGVAAILGPLAASLAVTLMVGAAFVVGGVIRLASAFFANSFGAGALGFLWGLIIAATGGYLMLEPGMGMAALTLAVAVLFLVDGIVRVVLSLRIRPVSGWGWMLAGGVVSIVFALLVGADFPVSGLWVLGTLVGVSLISNGAATIAVAMAARRATDRAIDALGV